MEDKSSKLGWWLKASALVSVGFLAGAALLKAVATAKAGASS
jgi:hypothetical protein